MDWIKQIFKSSKSQDNSDKQIDKNTGHLKGYKKQAKQEYLTNQEVNKIVDDLIAQINQTEIEGTQTIQNSLQISSQNTIKNIEKYISIEVDNQKVDLTSPSVQVIDIKSHLSDSKNTLNMEQGELIVTDCDEITDVNILDTQSFMVPDEYASSSDKNNNQVINPKPSFPRLNSYKEYLVPSIDEDWCLAENTYTMPLHKDILKLNIADHPFQNLKTVDKSLPPKKIKTKSKVKEIEKSAVTPEVPKTQTSPKQTYESDSVTVEDSFTPKDKSEFVPDDLFCMSKNQIDDYSTQRHVGKLDPFEFPKSDYQTSQRQVGKLNIIENEKQPELEIQKSGTRKSIHRDKTVEELNVMDRNTDHLETTIDSIEDLHNADESVFPIDDTQINKLNIVETIPVQDESHSSKYKSSHSKVIDETQIDKSIQSQSSLDLDIQPSIDIINEPITKSKLDSDEIVNENKDLEANADIKSEHSPRKTLLQVSENVKSYFRDNANINLLKKFNNSIARMKIFILTKSFPLILISKLIGVLFLLIAIFSNYWMVNKISYEKSGITGISSTYIGLFGITRQDVCTLQDGANVVLSRDSINFNLISPNEDKHNISTENEDEIPVDNAPNYENESEFIERAGVFRDSRAIGNLPKDQALSRSELFGLPFYDIEIKGIKDLMFAGKLSFFLFMISIFVLLTTIPFILVQYFPKHRLLLNLSKDGRIFLGYATKILWIASLLLHLSGLLVMMIYTRSSTCVDEIGRSVPSCFSGSFWLAVLSLFPLSAAYAFYLIKRRDKSPSNTLTQFCDNRTELPLENVDNDSIYSIV